MSVVSNTQPLRDLAERVMRENGWALKDLAERAGGARQKSWFGKVITARHRPTLLREDEIEALATGLRIPVRVVRTADLAGHGLMEIDGPSAALLPEVAELTPRQRAAVQSVILAMLEPGTLSAVDYLDEGTDATVLVLGGKGTGKTHLGDLAARRGTPDLTRVRGAQDEAAEAPQAPPPEEP